MLAQSKMITS